MNQKPKYAVLFTSRNTYGLFEPIFFKNSGDLSDVLILNIDVGSMPNQLQKRDELIAKYGIIDLSDVEDPNIKSTERDIELAVEYVSKHHPQIKWVFHAQNDGYFATPDFFKCLDEFRARNPEVDTQVGMLGFTVERILDLDTSCFGRGNLVRGIFDKPFQGHYCKLPAAYVESDYFVIESTCFTIAAVNVDLWKRYIKPDYDFIVYYWGDDISHQFMMRGVPTICIPHLVVVDDYRTKNKLGVPCSGKKDQTFLGDPCNHWEIWRQKWGWDFGFRFRDRHAAQFFAYQDRYENTLVEEMRTWSIKDGPKTLKDIEEWKERTV